MVPKKKHVLVSLMFCFCVTKAQNTTPKNQTPWQYLGQTFKVYTTAQNTNLRLSLTHSGVFKPRNQPLESEISVIVNPHKSFQKFLGIGGAITDASAEVFSKLSPSKQTEFLKAYFGKEGINYNIIRTSIHSSDFGLGSHTYIDEGDDKLGSFSIHKDLIKRIPLIKKAQSLIDEDDFVFYASPWSPPAFMKTNNNMLHGGKLLPKYYQSWANYFIKFIQAYQAQGIPVWGVTIQNEPMAVQRWESCIFTAEEERDFLKNYLGPTFHQNGFEDKKIVVWDHNRDLISHRANTIFEDNEAMKYAWGIGFHWYETWTGGAPKYENLKNIKESYPSMNLLFTEGCQEGFDPKRLNYWPNAERYGNAMINDFNNGTVGWTDWNILLNEYGGPNHVQNFCFSPIHANTKEDELLYTPTYYYIGHFSKFIRQGANRISTTTTRSTLESTSFRNENGRSVTVVMNTTNKAIQYKFIAGNSEANLLIEPHAIQSIVY